MASLAAKYDYLEKLTRKVCVSRNQEPPKKKAYVPFRGVVEAGPPKKKQKNKQKPIKGNGSSAKDWNPAPRTNQKPATGSGQKGSKPAQQNAPKVKVENGTAAETRPKPGGGKSGKAEFSTVDILRQRLHQKIEESRGQGPPRDAASAEVKKKREKRKLERERKKRKRAEFRRKQLAEQAAIAAGDDAGETTGAPAAPQPPAATATKPAQKDEASMVFNRVEVGEEYEERGTQMKEKKRRRSKVKGCLTPLTGKNYRQLLTRVEERKARLEDLRERDGEKARKEEEKMRWTNVLYKAEGLKIKDNEELLRASLKRKEKRREQRKRRWGERSQQVVEKMQGRQDRRRRNLQRRKQGRADTRKQKARKRGRVLPEDLKKVAL